MGEAVECWECEGDGYSYGVCPTCGGSGKLCDDCDMGVEFCLCEDEQRAGGVQAGEPHQEMAAGEFSATVRD